MWFGFWFGLVYLGAGAPAVREVQKREKTTKTPTYPEVNVEVAGAAKFAVADLECHRHLVTAVQVLVEALAAMRRQLDVVCDCAAQQQAGREQQLHCRVQKHGGRRSGVAGLGRYLDDPSRREAASKALARTGQCGTHSGWTFEATLAILALGRLTAAAGGRPIHKLPSAQRGDQPLVETGDGRSTCPGPMLFQTGRYKAGTAITTLVARWPMSAKKPAARGS